MATYITAEEVETRIRELAPIAKRDPNADLRAAANAELVTCYAAMARMQKAGIKTPFIDMGAL